MMKWRVVLEEDIEIGDWAVWSPELLGFASVGISEEDAIVNIRDAIELYVEPDV